MDTDHTLSLISDYALGLLAAEERRRVEIHARQCPDCREALRREQRVGALVRAATRATAPPPGRLAALRPALPAPRRPAPLAALTARLAPLTLAAVMLMMGLLFVSGRLPSAPAVFATAGTPTLTATSTQTHTPTATLAAAEIAPDEPPVALALPPVPQATPRP